jgi:hypothetical protein
MTAERLLRSVFPYLFKVLFELIRETLLRFSRRAKIVHLLLNSKAFKVFHAEGAERFGFGHRGFVARRNLFVFCGVVMECEIVAGSADR